MGDVLNTAPTRSMYAKIYANARDSVFLIDPKTFNIIIANPQAVEDTHYEREELEQMSFLGLFPAEDQEAVKSLINITVEWKSGNDPQRALRRKSGKKIIIEMTLLIAELENEMAISCTIRDITLRIKADAKIKEYSKALEQMNVSLEDRVKSRTEELANAYQQLQKINIDILVQKKELDDVMNNIQQGIFTINNELTINPSFSKYSESLFGEKQLAGSDLLSLLFEPKDREKRGADLNKWLSTLFKDPALWELLKNFALKEWTYLRPGENGTTEVRELKFEWRPIGTQNNISKMMVVCSDITLQKQLENSLVQKEIKHKEELELISQITQMPFDGVLQFLRDLFRYLDTGKAALTADPELRNDESQRSVMRCLHTIKGCSRQLKMNSTQKQAHQLESQLDELMKHGYGEQNPVDFSIQYAKDYSQLEKTINEATEMFEKITRQKITGSHIRSYSSESEKMISVPFSKVEEFTEGVLEKKRVISTEVVKRALIWLIQVPIKTLFDRLQQVAESLAEEMGIKLKIERSGEDVQISPIVSEIHFDGFLHAVRNSLDHGSSPPKEREAAGRPEYVTFILKAQMTLDETILIEFSDDGKGIDPKIVARKAVEKHLRTQQEIDSYSENEIVNLVFLPGFSTKTEASEFSGRGIGLDVLKDTVEEILNGEAHLESTLGVGTRIFTKLPKSSSSRSPIRCFGHFSSPDKAEEIKSKMSIVITAPTNSNNQTNQSPFLYDFLGLKEAQKGRLNEEQVAKIIVIDNLGPKEIIKDVLIDCGAKHFVSYTNKLAPSFLKATIRKLKAPLDRGLESYLFPGTEIKSVLLDQYSKKPIFIEELRSFVKSLGGFSTLPDIVSTICDEMLMNAVFDAPRDSSGKPKYYNLPRTSMLNLELHEVPHLKYGADQKYIGLSVEDSFGSLSWDILIQHIHKGYRQGADQVNQKGEGAGLGVFMIYDHSHCTIINIKPGKRTEIISLIAIGRSYQDYVEAGKCFSYFLES